MIKWGMRKWQMVLNREDICRKICILQFFLKTENHSRSHVIKQILKISFRYEKFLNNLALCINSKQNYFEGGKSILMLGEHSIIDITVRNRSGDLSSNLGFPLHKCPWEKIEFSCPHLKYILILRHTGFFIPN